MRNLKALVLSAVLPLGFATAAFVAPQAAHASTAEFYTDVTAEANCYHACGDPVYVRANPAGGDLVVVNLSAASTWDVGFSGGHYCINLDGSPYFLGVGSTNQLITDYSTTCNQNGDEWTITCTGTEYEFLLKNNHTGGYVTYNTSGVYHANPADGGDTFLDQSLNECP